jgi:hypothetical protein
MIHLERCQTGKETYEELKDSFWGGGIWTIYVVYEVSVVGLLRVGKRGPKHLVLGSTNVAILTQVLRQIKPLA